MPFSLKRYSFGGSWRLSRILIFGIKKPRLEAIFRLIARILSMRSTSASFSRPYPRSSSKISSFKMSFIFVSSSLAISSSLFFGALAAPPLAAAAPAPLGAAAPAFLEAVFSFGARLKFSPPSLVCLMM